MTAAETGVAPGALRNDLNATFRAYYETAFDLRDPAIKARRSDLLAGPGGLSQEPFLEYLPDYVPASDSLATVAGQVGLPELGSLLDAGLMAGVPRPYQHQVDALTGFRDGKNVVITSGTGSGKTEAFLMPVIAQLVAESASWSQRSESPQNRWYAAPDGAFEPQRKDVESRVPAMRAMVLYPMNALVDDQLVRLRRALSGTAADSWFAANRPGHRFWFGRYTSLTPVSGPMPKSGSRTGATRNLREVLQLLEHRHRRLRHLVEEGRISDSDTYFLPSPTGPEMRSRWDMQLAPPDVLITNYSMLNVALMRRDEASMFDRTRSWLSADPSHVFTLVVDELHLYRGTAGSEVSYLIRRLRERLGLDDRPEQFRVIATTASVDWDREEDRKFVTGFFDKPAADFFPIRGARVELPPAELPADAVESLRDGKLEIDSATAQASVQRPFREAGWRPLPMSQVAAAVFPEADQPEVAFDSLVSWAGASSPGSSVCGRT